MPPISIYFARFRAYFLHWYGGTTFLHPVAYNINNVLSVKMATQSR